jgi:hypothetical protein
MTVMISAFVDLKMTPHFFRHTFQANGAHIETRGEKKNTSATKTNNRTQDNGGSCWFLRSWKERKAKGVCDDRRNRDGL